MKAEAEIGGTPGVAAAAGEARSSPLEPLRKGAEAPKVPCAWLPPPVTCSSLPGAREHTCTCAEAEGMDGWRPADPPAWKLTAFRSSQAGHTVAPGPRRCAGGLLGSAPEPFSKECLSPSLRLAAAGTSCLPCPCTPGAPQGAGFPSAFVKRTSEGTKVWRPPAPIPTGQVTDSLWSCLCSTRDEPPEGRLCLTTKDTPGSQHLGLCP